MLHNLFWAAALFLILILGQVLLTDVALSGQTTQGWIMSHMPVSSEVHCE